MSDASTSRVFGSGEYAFRVVEGWAKWPQQWRLHDVAAVGVDASDRVYAFHRGEHPVIVFDRDGNVLRTFGSRWTRAATCTWARSRIPRGRRFIPIGRRRGASGSCRSSRR